MERNLSRSDYILITALKKKTTTLKSETAPNKVKTIDFGVNGRAGFDLGTIIITGFYSQGLSNFYTASYDGTFKHNVIGASVGFWLNKVKVEEKKPKDMDKDGTPDNQDICPFDTWTTVNVGLS